VDKYFLLPKRFTVDVMEEVRTQMLDFLDKPGTEVRCSAEQVEMIDAAGVQLLLAFYKAALKKGKELVIVNLSAEFNEVYHYSGMDKVFTVKED
jgi:anti-anti-sigma factor